MAVRPGSALVAFSEMPGATEPGWVENRPTRHGRALDLAELWRSQELARFLALRDLKLRYKQAALGAAWSITQPLVGAVTLYVVFHTVVSLPSDGLPYLPFAMVGYGGWTLFSRNAASATGSIVANSSLITKVYFPRLLAPIASILPGFVDYALGLLPLAVVMLFTGPVPGPELITLPLWVLGLALASLGVGLIFATANVRYRDAGSVLGLLTQLWFFVSPIAYPASRVTGAWRWVYFLNPVAGLLSGLRWCILGGPWPGAPLLASLLTGALLLVIGLLYFRSAERRFADVI
jgi:ABC-type polysaccharide/polyol phosphate export permease